jgi:hypothetical protein
MIATIPAEADVGEVAALKGTVAATATELQVSKDPAGQSGGGHARGLLQPLLIRSPAACISLHKPSIRCKV